MTDFVVYCEKCKKFIVPKEVMITLHGESNYKSDNQFGILTFLVRCSICGDCWDYTTHGEKKYRND